ncbi:hypothetical protein T440DRAFT_486657 [Plenodomus tracheiphilus IPT5]|uniref:Uncharacterized protein n=1 Tax=Plenodomus tracheiphilus IPT5 TaxID=1408161 RepID=A0A6A7BIT7_9PLEO|nr:hypothetical protein T440DRAFT_486657 [Plenodomus tracheiphilus IPT5]
MAFPLPDLPPELFSNVIHELVADIGIAEAWKQLKLHDSFHKAGEYLFYQVVRARPESESNPHLLNLVRRLASYLHEELEVPEHLQHQTTQDLCEGLSKTFLAAPLVRFLRTPPSWLPHPNIFHLCASISIGAHDLTRDLLTQVTTTHQFKLPFNLLEAAIKLHDETLFYFLMSHIEAYSGLNREQAITQFKVDTNISLSIFSRNLDQTKRLIQLRNSIRRKANATQTRQWIITAMDTNDVTFVQTFANMFPVMTRRAFKHIMALIRACKSGSADMINLLIREGDLDLAKGRYRTLPLAIAVRHGNTEVIGAIIDAGADVNQRLECKQQPRTLVTVAELAVIRQTDLEIIDYLISRGADLPHMAFWPGTKEYELFREMLLKKHKAIGDQVPAWSKTWPG